MTITFSRNFLLEVNIKSQSKEIKGEIRGQVGSLVDISKKNFRITGMKGLLAKKRPILGNNRNSI